MMSLFLTVSLRVSSNIRQVTATTLFTTTDRNAGEKDNTTAAKHLSTLYVKDTNINDVTVKGKDVILTIGTGSIKLVNAANYEFKVREKDGKETTRIYGTNEDNSPLYGGNNFVICGNGGNDHIFSARFPTSDIVSNVTINGSAGDDTINAAAKNVLIEYSKGDGNDIVHAFGSDDTLKISALSYTLERNGFDLIVHVENGSINLKGCRLLATLGGVNIDGTPESDLVNVEFYDMQLDGDKLSLQKLNPGEVLDVNETENEIRIIDASKSQTSVKIIGNLKVDMFTGSSKADVYYCQPPSAEKSLDMAMASNDESVESNVLASDSNETEVMTIRAGAGSDTIYGGGEKAKLYVYNSGDGNDVIYNVSATDTLSISGNSYTSTKSGDDVIVSVGKGSIKLMNAASLSDVNILGENNSELVWTLKGTTATYGTTSKTLFTVKGVKSIDGLNVDGKVVTVSNASLNQSAVTISDGYTLKLGSNVTQSTTTAAGWTLNGSKATYKDASTSEGYKLVDNQISYVTASGGNTLATVNGVKSLSGIALNGKVVTVSNVSLNQSAVTVSDCYTLKLGSDVKTSATKTLGTFSKVSSGTATFKTNAYSDFYTLKSNKISYTAAKSSKEIKISGLKSSATLSTVKKAVTVTENDSGACTITFNNADVLTTKAPTITAPKGLSYTVAVDDKLSTATKTTAWTVSSTNASLKSSTSATYTVKNNKVVYTAKKVGASQIVLSGLSKNVKAASIGLPAKKELTLDAAILGTKTSLKSNSGGYSVNLTGNMKSKSFVGTSGADKFIITATNAKVSAGSGNDTLSGGSGNDKIFGNNGNDSILGGDGADTLSGGSGNDKIFGNNGNDSILGGDGADTLSGGSGNDKIFGNNGNDSLWGDAGADTFIYSKGDGKDIIYGFEDDDLLKITGTFSASYSKSKSEVYFKVGNTSKAITLHDFSATTFHINNDTYKISGTKLVRS